MLEKESNITGFMNDHITVTTYYMFIVEGIRRDLRECVQVRDEVIE